MCLIKPKQNVVRYRQKYLRPNIVALFATYYGFQNGGVFFNALPRCGIPVNPPSITAYRRNDSRW